MDPSLLLQIGKRKKNIKQANLVDQLSYKNILTIVLNSSESYIFGSKNQQ